MDLTEFFDGVDVDSIAASTGRGDPLPPGDYLLQAIEVESKVTKAATGIQLAWKFGVLEPSEYQNRIVFVGMNIRNPSAQAQTIGIGDFKAFCLAVGIEFDVARCDATTLLYQPFRGKVGFGKTTLEYPDPKNEIKKYYPRDAVAPAAPAAAAPAQKPAVAPAARPVAPAAKPGAPAGLPWKSAARAG